jgi:hypothetical protein
MAAWVQQCNGAMSATVATLLQKEVGDEAGAVGFLGRAGLEAKWAGRWCQFGLAGRPRLKNGWAG